MTYPQKLSELLELTTASRHIAEHNAAEAERVGAYQEFGDDDGAGGIVGDEMAAKLLPKRSKYQVGFAARYKAAQEEQAKAKREYRKLLYG